MTSRNRQQNTRRPQDSAYRNEDRYYSASGRTSHAKRDGYAPKRRSKKRKSAVRLRDQQGIIDWIGEVFKFVLVAIVIMFCISTSQDAYDIGYSIFYEEAVDEDGEGVEIEITITEDMSVEQIGKLLEESGLIRDSSVFKYQELFSSSHGQIVAGTYTLSTEMTPSEIISELAENYVDPAEEEEESEDTSADNTIADETSEVSEEMEDV